MASWLLNLSLLFVFPLPLALAGSFPPGPAWAWISSIPQLDGLQFRDFASPIVQICANAYRFPRSVPIAGWLPSQRIAAIGPPTGGVHAVVYEEEHLQLPSSVSQEEISPRIVLAFRGTQISSSHDSVADVCADRLLWEGFDFASLPADCAPFDETTLDYFSQAVNYTLRVLEVYPAQSLLLTGHSLGAGLAILVSMALSETYVLPVIGFAAPATWKPMLERSLPVKGLENGNIVVIAHKWDQIMRSQWEGQVGLLCLYQKQEPDVCKACFADLSGPNAALPPRFLTYFQSSSNIFWKDVTSWQQRLQLPDGGDCLGCFFETHVLKNLIKVVNEGERPMCQQATAEKSSDLTSFTSSSKHAVEFHGIYQTGLLAKSVS